MRPSRHPMMPMIAVAAHRCENGFDEGHGPHLPTPGAVMDVGHCHKKSQSRIRGRQRRWAKTSTSQKGGDETYTAGSFLHDNTKEKRMERQHVARSQQYITGHVIGQRTSSPLPWLVQLLGCPLIFGDWFLELPSIVGDNHTISTLGLQS
jgi:hypothetical protein